MSRLHVKPEIDNITILYDILLPLHGHFTRLFHGVLGTIRDKIFILITSARINPLSKSVWIRPASCCALQP